MSLTVERRRTERRQREEALKFSVKVFENREVKSLYLSADTIDGSDAGLGLRINYPIEPGHIIRIKDDSVSAIGVVVWSMNIDNAGAYRAGVRYV